MDKKLIIVLEFFSKYFFFKKNKKKHVREFNSLSHQFQRTCTRVGARFRVVS